MSSLLKSSLPFFLLLPTAIACGSDPSGDGGRDASVDASMAGDDGGSGSDGGAVSDGGGAGSDGGGVVSDGGGVFSDGGGVVSDGGGAMLDAAIQQDANTSVISGGPCISGAPGQTAYRVRWLGNGPGSTAYPGYEINGLPDTSRDKTGSYGQIGFSPSYVDTFLGDGGLQLNSSNFVDIELSTLGVSTIQSATLSIYGRSYNTTASGSFNWQTFSGTGTSPTNLVANSAPYQWYSADMSAALAAGDDGVLLRIKAGPSSSSLVVNRIELCIEAQ